MLCSAVNIFIMGCSHSTSATSSRPHDLFDRASCAPSVFVGTPDACARSLRYSSASTAEMGWPSASCSFSTRGQGVTFRVTASAMRPAHGSGIAKDPALMLAKTPASSLSAVSLPKHRLLFLSPSGVILPPGTVPAAVASPGAASEGSCSSSSHASMQPQHGDSEEQLQQQWLKTPGGLPVTRLPARSP